MIALGVAALTKSYGDRVALGPVDLEVAQGERIALIGHNGSGKTTLLRIAVGLLDASTGRVEVRGRPAGSVQARRAVSWLGDTPTFYDDLSLLEHLEFIARMHGVVDWSPRADALLERLGLVDRRDDLPTTFSRGLRQKSAIAMAFVRPFNLMLVDEPFVGLDVTGREALLALLDEAAAEGAAQMVATHDLAFVERVGRVVALRDGVIIHDGAPPDDGAALARPG